MGSSQFAIEAVALAKRFGRMTALSSADLRVRPGTIHALVGENGAGKSTLISILSGLILPDAGALTLHGRAVQFRSPLDAVAAGIGTVHQHFMLAEALTVAENIGLGTRRSAAGWLFQAAKVEAEVARLAEQTGLHVDPKARVADLAVGLRQRVEILKALSRGAQVLLLDEPTAVLAPPEVEKLFENLRRMRDSGRTIVIVTHKLDEVVALASEVTVLRRGETVFATPLAGMSPAQVAEKMIGRETPALTVPPPVEQSSQPMLELEGASGAVNIAKLHVLAGEIVGIAGVEGNGQQELAELIAGTRSRQSVPGTQSVQQSGLIEKIAGVSVADWTPQMRSDAGLAYIPADRQREGLVLEFSLAENLHLREPLERGPLLDHRAMRERALKLLPEYGVRPPDPDLEAAGLSGGNQQKVIVARELSGTTKLILACNPTRGLDVGAAADVHARLIAAARTQNAAVLLLSSDLDEVLALSDRVAVLYRGTLSETWPRGVSKEQVGRAMVGAA